ncbi:MAG: PilZ domain-containing protein [Candidatus Omnitrophota bacterium]
MVSERIVNGNDKRVFERFDVNFPVRFIDLRQNQEGRADACNISAKGIAFLSHQELQPATALEIWMDLPDKGAPLYARGRVVWTTQIELNKWQAGVNLEKADLMGLSRIYRSPNTV